MSCPIILVAGRVPVDQTANPPDSYTDGLSVNAAGSLMVSNGGTPETFNLFPFNSNKLSALISEVDPVNPSWIKGFVVDGATGRLIFNLTLPVASAISGWPVAANGTICAV
jgi:hypothetical protein